MKDLLPLVLRVHDRIDSRIILSISFVPCPMSAFIFKVTTHDGRVMLYGNTYPHREVIRGAGAKWDAKDKAWYLPAGTDTGFLPAGVIGNEVQPKPAPVPYVAPRRRDGRCCDGAIAFFPSDDPYAHYGPLHYRCEHHGTSRSNYSGT